METILLTVYVLIWPIIVAGVLWTVCRGFLKDWAESRKAGRSIIEWRNRVRRRSTMDSATADSVPKMKGWC